MDKLPLLCIVFVALLGLTRGAGVIPDDRVNKAVGETVKFNTTLTSAGNTFDTIIWGFDGTIIVVSNPSGNSFPVPGYTDRITVSRSTGSLELRNLAQTDSGEYSTTIIEGNTTYSGRTTLDVIERVSGVEVTASSTDVVEGSSVSLFCSVSSGSSLSFRWMNHSSWLTDSDRVQLTDGNSTLTIDPVNRYDHGPFTCHVSNPVSNDIKDTLNLPVSYGPENTNISVDPLLGHYAVGSDISLFCSADSRPDANFTWFLNGVQLSDTGPELKLTNIQKRQSGDYTCQSFNDKTLRNDTSVHLSISVLEMISGGSVTQSPDEAIEGNPVNLTCDAAAGDVFNRTWMINGSDLTLADHMKFYEEKRVLSFQPVQKKDKGVYLCEISNPVSSVKAQHDLVVNYGPENIHIKGATEVQIGKTITLTCSAESEPAAGFTWSVNGKEIHNAAEYIKENANASDSGNYTCQANNDVTGKSQSAVREVLVTATGPILDDSGCQGGCIAGIVIACLVVVGAAAGVGYYFYRKKKSKGSSSTPRLGGGGQDNSATTGNKELNYADIAAFHRKDGGAVQLRPQNETSEYAQVRGNMNAPTAASLPTYNAHMQRAKRQAPQPTDYDEAQPYAQVRRN